MDTFDPIKYKATEKEAYSGTAQSYERCGGETFEALAGPVIDRAGLKPGDKVLDVACGIGIPSIAVAQKVGLTGHVTGIDIAPGMIDIARQRAARLGLQNVSFREADAESLPFPDESFDVVISAMGLIHTADRNKALQEMFRVARRNGVLTLSVWSTPERTVGLAIMAKTIREAWPAAVVPGAPTWFDFGADGVLEAFLSLTGFAGITVERIPAVMEMRSGNEYWERCLGISGKLQMLLGSIPPDVARTIEYKAKAAAETFRVGATIRIPNEAIVARAQKP